MSDTTTGTRYYRSDQYPDDPMILRRAGGTDEIFAQGRWQPTEEIRQHVIGENDFLDPVSEDQARKIAPGAFTA